MRLDQALDEYDLLLRRRRGEEGRVAATALAALREYLSDYCGYTDTEEITPGDLFHFLLDYYPEQQEPEEAVGLALLEAAAGFAVWLAERGERGTVAFAAAEERLRDDLPRTARAHALLQAHARRHDLAPPVLLAGEENGADIGLLGSGAERVARLDHVDYAAAQEERFTLLRVEPAPAPEARAALWLHSPARQALGEPPLGPLLVPAEAAAVLRPGDILHLEVAPARPEGDREGWEVLEVLGVRPGGYE